MAPLSLLLFHTLKHVFSHTDLLVRTQICTQPLQTVSILLSLSSAAACVSARATVMFFSRQSPTPGLNIATDAYAQMQLDTAERAAAKPVFVHYVISSPLPYSLAGLTSASEVAVNFVN